MADEIKQLVISPQNNYLAILTTHTVHIALLPDSTHLNASDHSSPLRLKTYTLGSVTHVTTQPAVVSALWHPLGVNGSCIVTITEDAVVRLWELSSTDRWSFDRPTLAIDLQKLADGTALDQDFGASASGARKGFSPDSFEMEVAAAAFGGRDSGAWSPMTLWIAMREGDVYALCPLLPEKWAPPPTLIPSLSVSIVSKVAALEDDVEVPEQAKQLAQQQLAWMGDLDNQNPVTIESPAGSMAPEVYSRPSKPGRVPKLQGPFDVDLAPEESEDALDGMLSDIYVIGGKYDPEELMLGEEDELDLDELEDGGLSVGVICLLSSSGRVQICLDLDGVEAQWLPKSKSMVRKYTELVNPPSLLTFQTIDTLHAEELYEDSWPMFSHDAASRYSFYITCATGITYISLAPWISRLEDELQSSSTSGQDFRLDLLVQNTNSTRQRVIARHHNNGDTPTALSACVVMRDPDLGYFLLSCSPSRAIAVAFETPEDDLPPRTRSPTYDYEPEPQPLLLCPPREVYQPSTAFATESNLPALLGDLRRSKFKRMINDPVRLSPATLTIVTDAHKVVSAETHRISTAAAELFRRCERLQIELREQITRANEVAGRVEAVIGEDEPGSTMGGNEGLESRISSAKERQDALTERLDKLKKRLARGQTGKELSDKEKLWIEELATLEDNVLTNPGKDINDDNVETKPWYRFQEVKALAMDLQDQVAELDPERNSDGEGNVGLKVPSEIRRQKIAQIMKMLDREQALVDATKGRLEKLSLS